MCTSRTTGENLKIFNLKMNEGKKHEEYNETIDKVLEVIDRVDAVAEAWDISIAHKTQSHHCQVQ